MKSMMRIERETKLGDASQRTVVEVEGPLSWDLDAGRLVEMMARAHGEEESGRKPSAAANVWPVSKSVQGTATSQDA